MQECIKDEGDKTAYPLRMLHVVRFHAERHQAPVTQKVNVVRSVPITALLFPSICPGFETQTIPGVMEIRSLTWYL